MEFFTVESIQVAGFTVYLRGTQLVGHSHRRILVKTSQHDHRQQRDSCPPSVYLRGWLNVVDRTVVELYNLLFRNIRCHESTTSSQSQSCVYGG